MQSSKLSSSPAPYWMWVPTTALLQSPPKVSRKRCRWYTLYDNHYGKISKACVEIENLRVIFMFCGHWVVLRVDKSFKNKLLPTFQPSILLRLEHLKAWIHFWPKSTPSLWIHISQRIRRKTNRNATKDDMHFSLSARFPNRATFKVYPIWARKLYKLLCIWLDLYFFSLKRCKKSQMHKHRAAVSWQRQHSLHIATPWHRDANPNPSLSSSWFSYCRFPQGFAELTLWCKSEQETTCWGGSKSAISYR